MSVCLNRRILSKARRSALLRLARFIGLRNAEHHVTHAVVEAVARRLDRQAAAAPLPPRLASSA